MLERFDAAHIPLVSGWARAHGLGQDMGDMSLYPGVGFVVDRMAVGFLFQTDCKLAYVGGILSDPNADGKARSTALDVLLEELRREANELGFRAIVGLPTVHELAVRFSKHGYITQPGHYAIRRV